ncbi:SgcJ/EcaC family oxidoreductase [Pyxidicoccus parkwayensis]|uniref:SgcJ/EcaC family oxidoreductase n=1 Tax=Pyxidicoccus parkwayensis TaxID=2813578 RepID=A0ABX7NWV1_9BACT|nr:SgcJ/EcaC family oxidoreductase [Pyxidicoccus parkwaysis]QSQ21856.1 SgcJ/EcaC family oxidoreductase [Pyxidicoccus parkwaysis]
MNTTTTDERLLRERVHHMFDAWNRGNGYEYASFYSEDCDYVAFDGRHLKGRRANAELHQELFDGFFLRGSRIEGDVESVRFVSPELAIVHAAGGVKLRWQKKLPHGRRSRQTLVAVKRDGAWEFTAFHNTRIQPTRGLGLHRILLMLGRK